MQTAFFNKSKKLRGLIKSQLQYSKPRLIRIRFDDDFIRFRRKSGLTEDVFSNLTSSKS